MRLYKKIRCFLILLGTANWYVGIDNPTFWQRVYGWRLGIKTSWKVAGIIWAKPKSIKN